MQKFATSMALMTLAIVSGCSQGTPGGQGTTNPSGKKVAYGQAEDTFNLTVPTMSSSLQQGETMEAVIGIKRALNFDDDVTLKFASIPKGVSIEPLEPIIKHGDENATITLKAEDQAPQGDFKIAISGHPSKGGDAHIDFKLKVTAKDSFTLNTRSSSTTLKQGEAKTVTIGIKRDKTFDQEVKLEISDVPTGVTIEPSDLVLKQGDSEVQITVTSADDAALGNFAIKITGHPTIGADSINELKLTVVKK